MKDEKYSSSELLRLKTARLQVEGADGDAGRSDVQEEEDSAGKIKK